MAEKTKCDVPVVVAARLPIKEEKRSTFLEFARPAVERTREEPGCISYTLYEDATIPGSFIFFEEWKSRADLAEHIGRPHMAPFLEALPGLLAGELDIRVYDVERVRHGVDDLT